jgi:hypothetical protein
MPKYVVHIGPPKTGSKYLQNMLFHVREALRADGIVYPDNWWNSTGEITHHPVFELLRKNRQSELKETFRRIISTGCRVVVLSCEDFEDLTPQQLEGLRDAIGNCPVEFVYYCRRWCERIPSAWKQAVTTGLYPTFLEFYLASVRHAQYSGFINSSLIWDKIVSLFGRNSLKLVSYNNLRDRKIDLFAHFIEHILEWTGNPNVPEDPIEFNVSSNTIDTEIVRALNWLDYQAVGRLRANMHIKFTLMRPAIDTRVLEHTMADEVDMIELSDGAEVFRLSWKEMQKYSDCLVPRTFFRRRLFELGTASIPYVRSNYLLNERAARELRALYKRVNETPVDAPGLT